MAHAYIGTSGWVYRHWRGGWYAGVPTTRWLEHSASRFTGLEANGTFYRLTSRAVYEDWARRTPPEFRFAIKAHRYLTHRKKLWNIGEGILKQREGADGLGPKLACVVWQLPAFFRANLVRLEEFAEALRAWPNTRHAVEFRHETWFTPEVARVLEVNRIAVCISDAAGWPRWDVVTTNLAYLRFHGHTHTYWNAYTEDDLRPWALKIEEWLREGRDVHAYFDNDAQGHAPRDAQTLMRMVGVAPFAPAEAA